VPIVIFSIYSVELELHDRKVYLRTYVRIRLELNYRSLENPRSNWVVVIDLELLSLACSGLGLGSCYVHQLCLCHPVMVMVTLVLLVWRIGFGVMGLELDGVMSMVQGYCPVQCWKPVVSYHTQI
jgi:hypothetical protein